MTEIGFVSGFQRHALKAMWLRCFDDVPEAVDFFLDTWLSRQSCIAALKDGEVAAALYLLPAQIQGRGERYKAHYIYGASTLPEYRGKGLMRQLLQFADTKAARVRGDCFSVLLPASGSLYDFYQASGYQNGFFVRMAEISRTRLSSLAKAGSRKQVHPTPPFCGLRRERLARSPGSVQWGEDHLEYATALNRFYGGDSLSCRWGYALYRGREPVEILEWAPVGEDAYLLRELLERCGAESFRFRLPADSGFLPGAGEVRSFGMLKILSNAPKIEAIQGRIPYLGLTLD